jgi:predicted RNA-binding Zn-ribbon protein involved in translation (DUF1610 family)
MSKENKKFECPDCGESSLSTEWDRFTEGVFGGNCVSIMDDDDVEYCSFVCPNCNNQVDGSEVVLVVLTVKEMIELMKPLGDVQLAYSTCTHKFYVSIPHIEIKEDGILRSFCHHRDTPLEAVSVVFEELKQTTGIVKDAWNSNREYFGWNGVAFVGI